MNNATMGIFLHKLSHMCIYMTIPYLWEKFVVIFRLKGVLCTVNFGRYFCSIQVVSLENGDKMHFRCCWESFLGHLIV